MKYTQSHWGTFEVVDNAQSGPVLRHYRGDEDPSPIGLDHLSSELTAARVRRPAVRRAWLERGSERGTHRRGTDPFIEVSWDTATRLAAAEIKRVRGRYGNESIFGGSYGWSSAGRFHHAQSQVHRFLNCTGGFVRSRDSYSLGAARVIMPRIVESMDKLMASHTSWDVLADHTELFVSFGGVPAKNGQMSAGGVTQHKVRQGLRRMADAGVEFVNVSPIAENLVAGHAVKWVCIRPGGDTAMMLGLAHELKARALHDRAFLESHCVGWERFEAYLTGKSDGTPKSVEWASPLCGVPVDDMRALAHQMGSKRTMINIAWALQRAEHGEQPFWMTVTLAAMLGQIGLPGGGFGVGYGAENMMGSPHLDLRGPSLPQGHNAVDAFIPVARIADMLLNPGASFQYDGGHYRYPDIRLVYWAGGNPFHHHQDLGRLTRAWAKPETVIVHEQFWTATAKRADLVLPATTTMEREDIGYASGEGSLVAMRPVTEPVAEARDDFAIFTEIARHLGIEESFTEGRDTEAWLRHLYDGTRRTWSTRHVELPTFDVFREVGLIDLSYLDARKVMLEAFREDPVAHPLPTPSGRIEIYSQTIASFALADCPGHPVWMPPQEWLGAARAQDYPLHLVSDQPERRLHSQLDPSPWSQAGKVAGREPVLMNISDAVARDLHDGEIVELYNDRGACLAGLRVSELVMPGVVRLATGAWYDPDPATSIERHGNPNTLTADRGASLLSQGCAAHSCLVDVRKPSAVLKVSAFLPPEMQ